ncbi:MAG: tetratricopeptide repeat protein [Gammaproteobacteria bacterium]|nr:tetratricopeptide repeat protein [Gammaproteobacteria bacterium]
MSQKYALLIGNGEYEDKNIPGLSRPSRNVEDLAKVLSDPKTGGFEAEQVKTLIDHSKSTIEREIARFFNNRKRDDLLLLYYAGHGFLDDRGLLYLAMRDMENDLLDVTAIPAAFIARQMGKSRAKQQILLLDCCHSGAFKAVAHEGASGATVAVLTASDVTEFAWEKEQKETEVAKPEKQAQHTVFTRHLLEGLTGRAAKRDGSITCDSLYAYLRARLKESKQNPLRLAPFGRLESDILLAKTAPVLVAPELLDNHYFISYAPTDGDEFALTLHKALSEAGVPVWLDLHDTRDFGLTKEEQIVEALQTCAGVLFIATADSGHADCTAEWTRAIKYKKPVIPLRFAPDVELPHRLACRQAIDFFHASTLDEASLKPLHQHLQWLNTPDGKLQQLKERFTDAQHDLRFTKEPQQRKRIKDDIDKLKGEIDIQKKIAADPRAAAERVQTSIARGLERERRPEKPHHKKVLTRFINPPPGIAPGYFQDRFRETELIGDFLKEDILRLLVVTGRGGIGKTALVARLLKGLESGRLPDDHGPLRVGGIVYLSAIGSRKINFPNIYADLSKLLPVAAVEELERLYKDPQAGVQAKMAALLAALSVRTAEIKDLAGPIVLLLDNFEDLVDPKTRAIVDAELNEALQAFLTLPPHALKVIITTRLAPRALSLLHPQHQMPLPLDEGLGSPYAENILREMDADGRIGLKNAPEELLREAKTRTRGYPRALEALFAILAADRDTDLKKLLADADALLLPENVVEVLVGEAFNRLDAAAQKVMQALAIYARPVTPTALDYLLELFLAAIDTAPIVNRLVNMQFVRKEAGHYYLHPVDRAYALARIPTGESSFSQLALYKRGANFFKNTRLPRENCKSIDDLAPQLAEFDLRYAGQDYETAARVLLEIDFNYLYLWGHFRLMIELHERLRGQIVDPDLTQNSVGNLGTAYRNVGQIQKAMACYGEALSIARDEKNRKGEGVWLGNLGNVYADLGQTEQAIEYYQQALAIGREIGDRQGEGIDLGNLGNCYADLGQTEQAIEYYQQALAIDREVGYRAGEGIQLGNLGNRYAELGQTEQAIEYYQQALAIKREVGDRRGESINLRNTGDILVDRNEFEQAIQSCHQAIQIADEISFPQTQQGARTGLACVHLYTDDFTAARAAAEAARRYDVPQNNHAVLALLGVIALRQADKIAAREVFDAAIASADKLLEYTAQNYDALHTRGAALCGLALCADSSEMMVKPSERVRQAMEAYRAAQKITSAAGIVGRALRLFDALAMADESGVLAGVRGAIKR